MPLREGSSDKVIQENIKCILDKDGCGYDPPYKDPARDEYTPAQAAAIAYAKAGRRNNTSKKTSTSKKTKSVKTEELKTPKGQKEEPKSNAQSVKPETETNTKKPESDIQVPEGWKVQQPGGDTETSKKNQPPKKGEDQLSPEEDKKMLDEVMEGYKLKWGNSASLLSDAWDTYNPKQKKKFLEHAKKIKAEEQSKQAKENSVEKAKTEPPAPAPKEEKPSEQTPTPTPTPKTPAGWKQKDDGWTAHLKPKFDDSGNITYQNKVYKPTKTLPGSTNPKLYSDEEGNPKFVVKEGGAEGQNNAEFAANQVYGILAPHLPTGAIKSRLIDGKLVNDFMPNSKTINDLSDDEFNDNEVLGKVKGSLVADALVANWDYMGLSNDNMMVDDKGRILRIDSGGTFNYRAQGEQKEFDAVPMEMWTLRSSAQGKQLWDFAGEEDYKNIWLNQMDALAFESGKLKKTIAASNLSPEVKDAFAKRVDILTIAGQEARDIASRDGVSWKGVDKVMERAFRYSSLLNTKDPDWANKVRNKIKTDLNKAFPAQAPKLDFNLPSSQKLYNESLFKNVVKRVDAQLNENDADYYGGDSGALQQISPEGKYALREYSGSLYQNVNALIRGKTASFLPGDKKFFEQIVDVMDESLSEIPDHPQTGTFYRMNKIHPKYADDVDAIKNLKPGDTYISKGFSSYTDEHEGDEYSRNEVLDNFYHSSKFNFITIYQGKNIKGIAPLSDIQSERESLMQRDKKLKVASVKEESISDWPSISWGGNEKTSGKVKVIYLTDAD